MDIKENFKGHLSTINHHKMEVMRLCFKVGLYKPVSYTHLTLPTN